MLRRSLALVVLAAAVSAGPAAGAPACTGTCFAAPARSGALFLFSGHGWGHGVGMSQYGAYGYAQHGSTYQQILAHYYPGTKLTLPAGPLTPTPGLKVAGKALTAPLRILPGKGSPLTLRRPYRGRID